MGDGGMSDSDARNDVATSDGDAASDVATSDGDTAGDIAAPAATASDVADVRQSEMGEHEAGAPEVAKPPGEPDHPRRCSYSPRPTSAASGC